MSGNMNNLGQSLGSSSGTSSLKQTLSSSSSGTSNLSQTLSISTSNLDQTLSSSSSDTSNLTQIISSTSSTSTINLKQTLSSSSSSSSSDTSNLKQTISSNSNRSDTSANELSDANPSGSKGALPLGLREPCLSAQKPGTNIRLVRDRILKQLQNGTHESRGRSTNGRHRRRESRDCSSTAPGATVGSESDATVGSELAGSLGRQGRREFTDCSSKEADATVGNSSRSFWDSQPLSPLAGSNGRHGRKESHFADCSSKESDAAAADAGTPSHSVWDSQPLSPLAASNGRHERRESTDCSSKETDATVGSEFAAAGTSSRSVWDSQPLSPLAGRKASLRSLPGPAENLGTLSNAINDDDDDDVMNHSNHSSQRACSESTRSSSGLSLTGGSVRDLSHSHSVRDLARGKCSIGLMSRNRAVHDPPIFHSMYNNRATSRCFGGLTTFQNRATMLGGPGIICEAHAQCSVCKQTAEGLPEGTVLLCFLDDPDTQCQLPAVICAGCSRRRELRGQVLKGRVMMPVREVVGNLASSCIDSAITGVTFREGRD